MSSLLANVAAVFITMPLLVYVVIFVAVKQWTKNHRLAVNSAINISTVSLMLAVHFIVISIWSKSYLGVMLIASLGVGALFTFIHWKLRDELLLSNVLKGYWRLNFLLFFFAYLILLVYGLSARIIDAVAIGPA